MKLHALLQITRLKNPLELHTDVEALKESQQLEQVQSFSPFAFR